MASEFWACVGIVAIPLLTGWTVLSAVYPNRTVSAAMFWSLSFPVGIAMVAFVCIGCGLMKIPLEYRSIVTGLVILQILCLTVGLIRKLQRKGSSKQLSTVKFDLKGWQNVMCLMLGLYVLYQIYIIINMTFLLPVGTYDEIVIIALKAKVFFYEASIASLKDLSLSSYPLMVPFEMLWTALNFGFWDETLIKMLFPTMFFAFAIFHYGFLREKYGPFWALLGVALLMSSNFVNFHASIGYQDLTMMVFNMMAVMLMVMAHRRRELDVIPLAGLLSGLGMYVKWEGSGYFVINAFLCLVLLRALPECSLRARAVAWIRFILPGAAVGIFLLWFAKSHGFAAFEGRLAIKHVDLEDRIILMVKFYKDALFFNNSWNVLWVLLGCSFMAFHRRAFANFEVRFLSLALTLCLGMYIALDLLTANWIAHPSVLTRVVLHFFPLVPTLIVILHSDSLSDQLKK
jgi:hypothetical protein